MKVLVSDSLMAAYLQPFGITLKEVVRTAVGANHSETITQPAGGEIILFTRRFEGPAGEFTVMGGGLTPDEDTVSVDFALKLLPDLTAAGGTPAALLRRLLDRVGINFTVGHRTDKLILGERIPVWSLDPAEMFTSDALSGAESTLSQALLRITGDVPQAYADCAVCFVIDVPKYLQYLGPAAQQVPEVE